MYSSVTVINFVYHRVIKKNIYLFNLIFFMSHLYLLCSITKKTVHGCNRTSAYEVRLGSGISTFPDKKIFGYTLIYQTPCSSTGLSMYT